VPQIKQGFFASVINGIEEVAYRAGYMIIVSQSNEDYDREVFYTRAMVSNRVAGMLVSISKATRKVDHFRMLQRRGVPIVFFDRVSTEIEASQVVVDDFQGAFDAVTHLIHGGYQRIAHLAGPEHISIGRDRLSGYRAALKKAGRPFHPEWVIHGGLDDADGFIGLQKLLRLDPLPDAIFAVNDPVATGAFVTIKENNLRVPGDIALVGFSNNTISGLLDPPLTTVEQPSYEMGTAAFELLLKQIESDSPGISPESVKLKTQLIVRKSS
jgi:LacI family transcriptional regulator